MHHAGAEADSYSADAYAERICLACSAKRHSSNSSVVVHQ
jgi:hypothetical protein